MKRSLSAARRTRGVSLVEALVALAVMAFGMLGVVGMQSTLRNGADQSKQRSEALRLAQEKMETLRGFALVAGAPAGELDYADIVSEAAASAVSSTTVGYAGNTTFMRSVTVNDPTLASSSALRMKHVQVRVTWEDREFDGSTTATAAQTQRSVVLTSSIARLAPELGASLGLSTNSSAPRRPDGRHPSVPRSAVDQGNGQSNFSPPGTTGVTWVFSNTTGNIMKVCSPPATCDSGGFGFVTGFINFAMGSVPTSIESEAPTDAALAATVYISATAPAPTTNVSCYVTSPTGFSFVQYFCAVPLVNPSSFVLPNFRWSGTSFVTIPSLTLASAASDFATGLYKVCRYTPDATTDTPAGGNASHPKVYVQEVGPLINQNFLIIDAGDGVSVPYSCPLDGTNPGPLPTFDGTSALVDGDTRLHQP